MQISRVVKFIRKGEKGDGVVSTEIRYVISLNGTTPPLDQSNWTESIPTLIKGRYLWTRTILTYSDGSKSYSYTVSYIAKDGEKGDKGDPGTNYLILGWWSDEISYKLSDAGIPVVKVPDGTSLGFSVYSLDVQESTIGASPGGSGASEWKLVESAEFVYMQDAYIERLQAALVTADRIESLLIRTGNLEVLHGAKLAGLGVEGNNLVSENKKLIIDGLSNTISLLDDNFNVKTVIRPSDLPASVSDYFSGTEGGNGSLTALKGTISAHNGTRSSASVSVNAGSGKVFEVSIPSITLSASINYTPPSGGMPAMAHSTLVLYLTNGSTEIEVGRVVARSSGGTENTSDTLSATTRTITTSGSWRLMARLTVESLGGGSFSGSGTIASTATTFTVTEVVNRTEVGRNGIVVATSAQNYDFMVGGTHQIRRGNNMLQITGTQLRVSRDGGNSWTNLGS